MSITTSNLLVCLNGNDPKSNPINQTVRNHGYAVWRCMYAATITYSCLENTSIIQDNAGTLTTIVAASGSPQRGTFASTAGYKYYGSGGPIYLIGEGTNAQVAPLSLCGKLFGWGTARNNPGVVYVYALENCTVNYYEGVSNGTLGVPTSSAVLSAGGSTTFSTATLTNHYLKSSGNIIATTAQNGGGGGGIDETILSPMSTTVFNRYWATWAITSANSTPMSILSTNNTGRYGQVTNDQVYPVMMHQYADGSGSDCMQGLGEEFLSDTYIWGTSVSDYVIAAPYDNTVIVVSWWNGSAWSVQEIHTLSTPASGTPYGTTRDGTIGPGVEGGTINGGAAYFQAGSTGPWKFEGNKPFFLAMNDTADDEMAVLGFCRNWYDTSGNGNNTRPLTIALPSFTSNNMYFNGNGTVWFTLPTLGSFPSVGTLIYVMKPEEIVNWRNPIATHTSGGNVGIRFELNAQGNFVVAIGNDSASITGHTYLASGLTANTWYHIVVTWNVSANIVVGYLNGVQIFNEANTTWPTQIPSMTIGLGYNSTRTFKGWIDHVLLYNKQLSTAEVVQDFATVRGRYGL